MLRQSLDYFQSIYKRVKTRSKDSSVQSDATPFIFDLSFDIMESVWSYLSLRERVQCTQVCRPWRTQLLGSSVMWSELSGNISRSLKPYKIDGSDIRQVDLELDPDGLDFLLSLKCSNIRSITGAYIRNGNDLMSFHELLCCTGPALRSLFVRTDTTFEDILTLIFMRCSDLTYLRLAAIESRTYHIPSNHSITADSPMASAMKRVINLDLLLMDINDCPMKRILPLFSGLKDISIASKRSPNYDLLPWLDDMFSGWQGIRLGQVPIEARPHTEFREQGCKTFTCGLGWIINTGSFESLLKKYGDTMTAFHMASTFIPSRMCDTIRDYLINIGATSRLRSLVLDGAHNLVYGFSLEEILDGLPCLEQLVFSRICFDGMSTGCETRQLPMDELNRSLKIVKFVECFGMDSQRLHRLSHRFHSCMRVVWFNGTDIPPNEVLDSVTDNVSSLDTLFLVHTDLTNDHVLKFAESWKDRRLNRFRLFAAVGSIDSPRQLQNHVRQILKNTRVSFYPVF